MQTLKSASYSAPFYALGHIAAMISAPQLVLVLLHRSGYASVNQFAQRIFPGAKSTQSRLWKWLNDYTQTPRVDLLQAAARTLNIPLTVLTDEAETAAYVDKAGITEADYLAAKRATSRASADDSAESAQPAQAAHNTATEPGSAYEGPGRWPFDPALLRRLMRLTPEQQTVAEGALAGVIASLEHAAKPTPQQSAG